MLRPLYALAIAYVALCVFSIGVAGTRNAERRVAAATNAGDRYVVMFTPSTDAGRWFATVRPFCNPVEVEVRLRELPPPATADGTAFAAACLALAGRIDHARQTIDALPAGAARSAAAGVVFDIGHPVADAGDDAAAGPIMRLVIEYQPDNYMALYHAGMSEYALGHTDVARDLLVRFGRIYTADDGWTANAREVLGRIGGADRRAATR
jgi:hypothetical protein